jgi:hypothetical protein
MMHEHKKSDSVMRSGVKKSARHGPRLAFPILRRAEAIAALDAAAKTLRLEISGEVVAECSVTVGRLVRGGIGAR